MRVKNKEEIIRTLERIEPDDFEFIKINCGTKHKCFGNLNKKPVDDLTGYMFDISLWRSISSLTLLDGGLKYSSPLVIGTTTSKDGTTNIDADVIEAIGLVLKRRIDADCPLTKQYMRAVEEREKERQEMEERQAKRNKREKPKSEKKSITELMDEIIQEVTQKKKEHDFFNPFTDDLGMP